MDNDLIILHAPGSASFDFSKSFREAASMEKDGDIFIMSCPGKEMSSLVHSPHWPPSNSQLDHQCQA